MTVTRILSNRRMKQWYMDISSYPMDDNALPGEDLRHEHCNVLYNESFGTEISDSHERLACWSQIFPDRLEMLLSRSLNGNQWSPKDRSMKTAWVVQSSTKPNVKALLTLLPKIKIELKEYGEKCSHCTACGKQQWRVVKSSHLLRTD